MYVDRPRPGSWKLSRDELDGAIHAIEERRHIDHKHDIPYIAGYSKDGETLYLDRRLPSTILIGGKQVDIRPYILLHEEVEKALEDEVGLAYLHAHQIALRAERAAVEANGLSWPEYNSAVMRLVARIGDRSNYPDCPKNLDMQPYKDENDKKTMERMAFT